MRKLMMTFVMTLMLSGQSALADDTLEKKLTTNLSQILPDIVVTGISKTPVEGIYEVQIGADLLYMTADGQFVLKGDLFDLANKRNISRERRAEARVAAFKGLGNDKVIEFAPQGKTEHVLYVYTDIDCSYCQRFHNEVPELNKAGIAVRYLPFPRAGIGSESHRKFASVYCAADRNKALTDAKASRGQGMQLLTCDNPVAELFELGKSMGVRGTPAVYLETGDELGGYIPAEQLIKFFEAEKS